jgi:quinol monooxygenase YgiN
MQSSAQSSIVSRALVVGLNARQGQENATGSFLISALPLVAAEPATTAWYALSFGDDEYGIFDVFPDDAGRDAHLAGPVAQALGAHADTLFASPPGIRKATVLASKLPAVQQAVTKAVLLTFRARERHEADVAQFLRDARQLVDDEPGTIAWFALDFEDGEFGIFDVFPDNAARLAHLTGHVPRELTKHALTLLGGLPTPRLPDVLAQK